MKWILESGFLAASNEDTAGAHEMGKLFAITSDHALIEKFIDTPYSRKIFERIIAENGLNSFVNIRFVDLNTKKNKDYLPSNSELLILAQKMLNEVHIIPFQFVRSLLMKTAVQERFLFTISTLSRGFHTC